MIQDLLKYFTPYQMVLAVMKTIYSIYKFYFLQNFGSDQKLIVPHKHQPL